MKTRQTGCHARHLDLTPDVKLCRKLSIESHLMVLAQLQKHSAWIVIPSAAIAGQGTLRRPTLWMPWTGVPCTVYSAGALRISATEVQVS